MILSFNSDVTGSQLALDIIDNNPSSYEELIEFILEMDFQVADVDFTMTLVKELSKSLQVELEIWDEEEIEEYNVFIESLKIKGDQYDKGTYCAREYP